MKILGLYISIYSARNVLILDIMIDGEGLLRSFLSGLFGKDSTKTCTVLGLYGVSPMNQCSERYQVTSMCIAMSSVCRLAH